MIPSTPTAEAAESGAREPDCDCPVWDGPTAMHMPDCAITKWRARPISAPASDGDLCARLRVDEPMTRWLIERGQQENHTPTVWYVGHSEHPEDQMYGGRWTENANRAVYFITHQECETAIFNEFARYKNDPRVNCHASEHGWLADTRAPIIDESTRWKKIAQDYEADIARLTRKANEANRIIGNECERQRERAEAAEAKLDAAMKDAERYRWLRMCTAGEWDGLNGVRLDRSVLALDAAIDTERALIAESGSKT